MSAPLPPRPPERARPRRACVAASGLLAGACLAPPALLESHSLPFERARALYPPESEPVELAADSGATLRGLFVPAGSGAPVVLHLLDSSGSLAGNGSDFSDVAARLSDMGFASLFCDYAGVGVSAGERSVAHLAPDARALWREAVRRADGDPRRVVIRAISIGTIAAEELLDGGARPGAVVLHAPAFPETAVMRFAHAYMNPLASFAAVFVFRPIARFDPCAVIRASGVPCSAVASPADSMLSADERAHLRAAVEASGGRWIEGWGEHVFSAMQARHVAAGELDVLAPLAPALAAEALAAALAALPPEVSARLASGSAERARFESLARSLRHAAPPALAAAALANDDWHDSARMLWLARRRPYPALAFDDLVEALSLRAPVKPLSIDAVEVFSAPLDLAWRYDGSTMILAPAVIATLADQRGAGRAANTLTIAIALSSGLQASLSAYLGDSRAWLVADGRTPAEASRTLARLLLKALRIPDRLRATPEGGLRLEGLWGGAWLCVPLASEAP